MHDSNLEAVLFREHDNFIDAVRATVMTKKVVVFLAADRDELSFLLSIKELLFDSRLILILPGRNKESLRKGLSLFPHYHSYADGAFKDVAAVLKKMSEQIYVVWGNEWPQRLLAG